MTTSDLESSPKRNPLVGLVEGVGNGVLGVFQTVGGLVSLAVSVAVWTVRPPFRLQNLFAQFDFVGVGSIVLVALTGTFSGMVFATQSWSAFELFGASSRVTEQVDALETMAVNPVQYLLVPR